MEPRPKKLLDQVRDAIRLKHYSIRTKQAYIGWIKRYIFFQDVRHPAEMGAAEVEAFLTHLAVPGTTPRSSSSRGSSAACVPTRTRPASSATPSVTRSKIRLAPPSTR